MVTKMATTQTQQKCGGMPTSENWQFQHHWVDGNTTRSPQGKGHGPQQDRLTSDCSHTGLLTD